MMTRAYVCPWHGCCNLTSNLPKGFAFEMLLVRLGTCDTGMVYGAVDDYREILGRTAQLLQRVH